MFRPISQTEPEQNLQKTSETNQSPSPTQTPSPTESQSKTWEQRTLRFLLQTGEMLRQQKTHLETDIAAITKEYKDIRNLISKVSDDINGMKSSIKDCENSKTYLSHLRNNPDNQLTNHLRQEDLNKLELQIGQANTEILALTQQLTRLKNMLTEKTAQRIGIENELSMLPCQTAPLLPD